MRLVKVLLVSHLKEFAVAKLSVQRQNFGIGVISRLPFEGNPKPPYSAVGAFGSIAPSGEKSSVRLNSVLQANARALKVF